MFEKLEAYLEEISHFLSSREEREEILSEIRSHILEKAELEFGEPTEATLAKVIAAYGPARRVAEKYLDGSSIIAPALATQLPKGLDRAIEPSLTIILFIICIFVAVDLIKAIVRIGRKRLAN